MFKYCCYVCDKELGKGIPPAEALSRTQNSLVGHIDAEERFTVLDGTRFEGMSTYSFCGFCLLAIRDLPQVFEEGVSVRFLPFVQSGRMARIPNYATDEEWDEFYSFDWQRANRMIILIAGAYIYRKYDFSLLHELLNL